MPGTGGGTHTLISSSPDLKGGEMVKEPKVKRMNLNVDVDLHNAFKAATAAQGENMTDVLLRFIEDYVAKKGVAPKKGRR
jgi:hypothetical protein